MKNSLTISSLKISAITILAVLFSTICFSQARIGAGVAYGSEINEAGLYFKLGANATENLVVDADLNYFFPGDDGFFDVDVMGFNLNAQYNINLGDVFYIYPLGGLNYTRIKREAGNVRNVSSEFGGNVGGGLGLNLGSVSPFLQGKYVLSNYDQSVVNVGVVITFNN